MDPRGTLFVNAKAGRALRKAPADLAAADVLYAVGEFGAGDPVWLVVRGGDGGQGVFATGVATCGAAQCREHERAIVAADTMRLLWPPAP